MFQDELIKSLTLESEQRFKQVRELEAKLIQTHQTIEQRNMDLREVEHKAAQNALIQQSEKALIVGLQTEKKHLEKSLKEN